MKDRNAWLDIPLADYEAHMSLPAIAQARMLAEQLEALIARFRPGSLAVVGCAGGNGFERVGAQVERVVAIDINRAYLDALESRFAGRWPGLELICADVQSPTVSFAPVELVYAALIFEYVNAAAALEALRKGLRAGGVLAALVQLPSPAHAAVSASPYASLQGLSGVMRLVPPDALRREAARAGFAPADSRDIGLASGKRFRLELLTAR